MGLSLYVLARLLADLCSVDGLSVMFVLQQNFKIVYHRRETTEG